MKTIHTFGDSHAWAAWGNIKLPYVDIKIHHLGARLMYNFGRDGLKTLNIAEKEYNVLVSDIVCFCFGEIDCRYHIHKHNKDDYKTEIPNIVHKYIDAICLNIQQLSYNVIPWVFNVVPTIDIIENATLNKQFPHLGNNDQRKQYVLLMNDCLRKECDKHAFLFVDIYKEYCNDKGFFNEKLKDESVHIGEPSFLENFIRNNLNILNPSMAKKEIQ